MSRIEDSLISILVTSDKGFTSNDLELMLQKKFNYASSHHGSVSSRLNEMHKAKTVFMLREDRSGRHPYVYHSFKYLYPAQDRYDKPPRKNRWKMVADKLYEAMTSEDVAPTAWEDALTSYKKLKEEND